MKNELLVKWLNGKRNYTVGMVLYGQFGNDESIIKQLAAGKNNYSEKLLLDKINALAEGEETKVTGPVVSNYEVMPDDTDKVLQSLKDKWMPMFTEMNYKRHALDKLLDDTFETSGIKRGQLAMEILNLEKNCIHVWQDRDYYLKHKTLPGVSINEEKVIDPFLAAKRIELLKIYVRRYKNILKKAPGNPEAAQLLKQYEDELTQLNKEHG